MPPYNPALERRALQARGKGSEKNLSRQRQTSVLLCPLKNFFFKKLCTFSVIFKLTSKFALVICFKTFGLLFLGDRKY